GIRMNFASLPDGCGIMYENLSGATMLERNASASASTSAAWLSTRAMSSAETKRGDATSRRRRHRERRAFDRRRPARPWPLGRRGVEPRAQIARLGFGRPDTGAPLVLPDPGRDAADQHTKPDEDKNQNEQRRRQRQRRMRGIERIERDGDDLPVRHGKTDDHDDVRRENRPGDELAHGQIIGMQLASTHPSNRFVETPGTATP